MDSALQPALDPAAEDQPFAWRNCWYPVSFLQDLPRDKPTGFTLYDEPFVLFVDGADQLVCLKDRCPHRAAKLSDGQMRDGRLECLYHGWQFGQGGQCHLIPQLYPDKDIPERAHAQAFPVQLRQGLVWVWPGDPALADPALIPLRDLGPVHSVTFQMDLPYDQTYLIENVIDIAHIHIAHDGVRGGGLRAAAKPLDFRITDSTAAGFAANFRSVGLERAADGPSLGGALVEFVAPNLVRYTSAYQDPALVAGLELFSVPLGKNRCRILYHKYSNFTSARERLKPRWLEHQTQCLILEQDMAVVIGQHEGIERDDIPLRDLWLPLKTSDRLVVEYRRWLDRFGQALPFHRGFATARNSSPALSHQPHDRHHLHTAICSTCRRLDRQLTWARRAGWALAALGGLAGVALGGSWPLGLVAALGLTVGLLAQGLQSRI